MYRVITASADQMKKNVADMYDWLCDADYTDEANDILDRNGNGENSNGDIFDGTDLQKTYKDFLKLLEKANGEGRLDDDAMNFLKSKSVNSASRAVRASAGGRKVTGKGWPEFIKNIETQTKFKVDSSCKRRPTDIVDLIDVGGDLYEGEVTRYRDGTYELMFSNISGPFENDHMW